MNTPIMNGIDFLKLFQDSDQFKKENIMIVVMYDDLSSYFVSAAKEGGISYFVPFQFCLKDLARYVGNKFNKAVNSAKSLPMNSNSKRKPGKEVNVPVYR